MKPRRQTKGRVVEQSSSVMDVYNVSLDEMPERGDFARDYFRFFTFLFVAACLKTIQRQVRIPYTTLVFVLTTAFFCVALKVGGGSFKTSSGFVGAVGVQAIMTFIPAFAVHTAQGINNYIFRRCHIEIIVFSVGTFSMTAAMAYLYARRKVADYTWADWECVFFGIFLCSVERMPLSDVLFEEGRYPVIATMIQSESLFNMAITWCIYGFYVCCGSQRQDVLLFPLQNQVLAVAVGASMGGAAMMALRIISFGSDSAIAVVVCVTYFTYFFLEMAGSSGVTGVIVYTFTVQTHRFVSCTELEEILEDYWAVLFDLTGTFATFVTATYTANMLTHYFGSLDYLDLFLCYIAKTCMRCIAVVMLYPIIGNFGYRITLKQAVALIGMGVKGTYTMSLASFYHMSRGDAHTESVSKSFVLITWDMLLTQAINVFFLPYVLRVLGVLEVSEVEWNTMNDAVLYIQEAADTAGAINHSDPYFLLADWKWVRRNTRIINPLEGTFRFQSKRMKNRKRRSSRRMSENFYENLAVENVLRIESVSYARQHRDGTIQKTTMMALLAALQYPYDKKIYLDMEIITSLVDIPGWIIWVKDRVPEPTGEDETVTDDSEIMSEGIVKPLTEKLMDLFEHEYYEVVITNTSLAFVMVLAGALGAVASFNTSSLGIVLLIEGVHLTMFFIEVALMISAYGQKFVNLDNYNKLDLILLATCISLFTVQAGLFVLQLVHGLQGLLCYGYIFVTAVRIVHAVKYVELIAVLTSSFIHRYLNSFIYAAYEAGHAIVTGEEEVQKNVWKFVDSAELAMDIRQQATLNRLLVLRKLTDIQSRFPGIMVAFRSRQASTTILGDLGRELGDMQREGVLDLEDYQQLRLKVQYRHMRIIGEECSLPTTYKPIAMLRVIPWIKSDIVRQFLAIKIRPVSFAPGEVIVERGEENPIILTYSGILKIEGDYEERGDGALPNSASLLFYFSEGYFVDYVASPACIGELGLTTDELSITRVIAETQINAYLIPRERLVDAMGIFTRAPSFIYQIWAYIANKIGLLILQTHPKYQTWPVERIMRRLESFVMPNLEAAAKLILTPDVYDTILIQGVAMDTETQDTLTGPIYVPRSVRRLSFPGIYHHRVRPILLLIADKRYRLPAELDWLRPSEAGEDDESHYQEYLNKEFGQQEQQAYVQKDDEDDD